ncbi:cytochrome c-type biogenesis protein CcmH [Paracoccus sp. p4-l81]|uniref:cytochrome c-type biogenesis protein n=1 Tax=unclassified Paracoccus (in: a-proteobacteria) TaxID=2688777 RepID=UPI0035B83D1C
MRFLLGRNILGGVRSTIGGKAPLAALTLCLTLAMPALAVQPDEVLPDPALESRAREISKVLRCPVCQGENIDESNAEVSRDLRLLVRERLVAGDSNTEVVDFVTDRYGDYVLFEPRATGTNLILYAIGPVVGLLALIGGLLFIRSRRPTTAAEAAPSALTDEERARLDKIMRE